MKTRRAALVTLVILTITAFGCSGGGAEGADAAAGDTEAADTFSFDSGLIVDAGAPDMGGVDTGCAGCDTSAPDAPVPDDGLPDSGPADTGADTCGDAGAEDCGGFDAGFPETLTPAEIGFEEKDAPMTGSFIYYGNWGVNLGGKDSIEMIRADGSAKGTRFALSRLWSFGVSRDAKTIAFSSADPYQEQRFGITIGDAIQYTWILKEGEAPYQLTKGSVNDECHAFMPGDAVLLMCRRANFWQKTDGTDFTTGNDPYRILTVDIASGMPAFLTPLDARFSDIGPALLDDGAILFWRQEFRNNKPYQSMMSMSGDGSGVAYVQVNSTSPVASPDGTKVLFRSGGWRTLALAPSHDLPSATIVYADAAEMIFDYDFSPDSAQVVFSMSRADANCDDLYTINTDGTGKALLIDCVIETKYPNGVKWVDRR